MRLRSVCVWALALASVLLVGCEPNKSETPAPPDPIEYPQDEPPPPETGNPNATKDRIVYRSDRDGAIYSSYTNDTGRIRISGEWQGSQPTWTFDGRAVVYSCFNNEAICRASLSGKNNEVMFSGAGNDFVGFLGDPALSPDGTKLLFSGERLLSANVRSKEEVWIYDLVSETLSSPTLNDPESDGNPAWTPAGGLVWVEVSGDFGATVSRVVHLPPGATEAILLTESLGGGDLDVSPDGSKLAFILSKTGGIESQTVAVMNLDGTGYEELDTGRYSGATWGVDGQTVGVVESPSDCFLYLPVTGTLPTNTTMCRLHFPDLAPAKNLLYVSSAPKIQEGDSGNTVLSFEIQLAAFGDAPVSFSYATVAGSAQPNSDFTPVAGSHTFQPGQTRRVVDVQIVGDTDVEGNERLSMVLSDISGAEVGRDQATTLIENDDVTTVGVNPLSVPEGDGGPTDVTFNLTLSDPRPVPVKFQVNLAPGGGEPEEDARVPKQTIEFAPGETVKPFTVTIIGDTIEESDERIAINATPLQNYFALETDPSQGLPPVSFQYLVTIIDDDGDVDTPSPGRIVFVSEANGGFRQLFTMKSDGSDVKHISANQGSSHLGDPSWSSDGSKIIYTGLNGGQPEIIERPADGSGSFNLLVLHASQDIDPVYKPGSLTEFWWASNEHGDFDLFRGPGRNHITTATADEVDLTFGSDATKIAYASDADGDFDIYLQTLDPSGNLSGSPVNLTQEGSGVAASTDVNPDFSSDGSKIVFDGTRNGNSDIYVVDVASKAVTRLTTDAALEYEPTFAPDGQQIAFVREVGGDPEIFRMDAQPGASAVNISNNPGLDGNPEWGPASTTTSLSSPEIPRSSRGIVLPALLLSMGAVLEGRRRGRSRVPLGDR